MILALTFVLTTVFIFRILPASCFSGYSTLLAPANEVLIPPELLSSKTVWTPDRELGQYEDLVARVTNFHNEDKGFMVLDGDVFDVPIRKDIVHRVVRWQLAKRQQVHHRISRSLYLALTFET
jgi:large subunit ribosomal protein L4